MSDQGSIFDLMSSPQDSPASPSPKPDVVSHKKTRAGSGRKSPVWFASWDPATSSWKTSVDSSAEDSTTSSPTWPVSGSMSNGECFAHPTWELLIDESASSSLRRLPTPVVSDSRGSRRATARTESWTSNPGVSLTDAIWLLPTPVAQDDGKTPEAHLAMKSRLPGGAANADHVTGGARADFKQPLLPTPGAWLGRRPENAKSDPERMASRQHEGARGKRSLELPDALATRLTGASTPTPSDAGSSSEETLPPSPPTSKDA